jgi:hypothetical protein
VTRTQRRIEEFRQGEMCIEVRDSAGCPCAGVPVWVEQETHSFVFGCVAPDLEAMLESDRQRCKTRLNEVFNRLTPAGQSPDPGAISVMVPDGVELGSFQGHLDELAAGGLPLDVYVRGCNVGLGPTTKGDRERAVAERVAAFYTLCFAHPAVWGLFWVAFWDGEAGANGGGLVRLDFAPKPAFRYLHKLIGTVWHSRANGETDAAGRFRFRGFFGDYRVAARVGEAATTVAAVAHRREDSPFLMTIPDAKGKGDEEQWRHRIEGASKE